ncbi:MAG: response regulator [Proteobacteria bacterium]|nr:response regulator [Pseudomonadota bacterium]
MRKKTEKEHVKILIVDDHLLTREMVRMILKGLGFNTLISVESAFEAVEQLKLGGVDLVICDWNMPKFSGLELLRTIRTSKKFHELPFLMLTAEAYRESLKEAVKAGVTDYIAKPFTAEVLQEKLEKILGYESL